jgi:hypothetical protein
MHENRETSEMPEANLGDRPAGEGKSRTARVHVFEESDSGTVPMNHSNKSGKPPAESEEGRPLIKENTHQSSTHSTQSEARVSQGLAGVRKAARERKEMKFTALLHHMTVALLRESFYALKRKAAPGVDGVTWQEYETGLEDRLADLHSRVHRGAYRAQPSRRVYIPKPDGRQRPLGVAALEDRRPPRRDAKLVMTVSMNAAEPPIPHGALILDAWRQSELGGRDGERAAVESSDQPVFAFSPLARRLLYCRFSRIYRCAAARNCRQY